MPETVTACTTQQLAAAAAAVDGFRNMCHLHQADVEFAATIGRPDRTPHEVWARDYWDDVMFELQMKLGLNDEEVEEIASLF